MSVQSEINRIKSAVNSAYTAVDNKGGTVPASKTVANLATAINSISGGIAPSGTINISENGTYDVTNYASANVDVEPTLQNKTVTSNGTVTADAGYDGLGTVTVNVSGGAVMVEATTTTTTSITFPNTSGYKYYAVFLDARTGYVGGTNHYYVYTFSHETNNYWRQFYWMQNKFNFTQNSSADEVKRSGDTFNVNSSYVTYGLQFNASNVGKYVGFFWN